VGESENPLADVLLQLGQLAQEVRDIDGREAEHFEALRDRLREITGQLAPVTAVADSLTALTEVMAGLETRVGELEDPGSPAGGYSSPPQPKWWAMEEDSEDRAAALTRLRSWIEGVYRPGMGRPAAQLPPCWDQHPACVYILDWLSELWSVLYPQPQRPPALLSGQAEWWTRLLPAAADLMAAEARGCEHVRPAAGVRPLAPGRERGSPRTGTPKWAGRCSRPGPAARSR
jgi:hypothetical protein